MWGNGVVVHSCVHSCVSSIFLSPVHWGALYTYISECSCTHMQGCTTLYPSHLYIVIIHWGCCVWGNGVVLCLCVCVCLLSFFFIFYVFLSPAHWCRIFMYPYAGCPTLHPSHLYIRTCIHWGCCVGGNGVLVCLCVPLISMCVFYVHVSYIRSM